MRLQFLSQSDIETIVGLSLRTLGTVGCIVKDAPARSILGDAGARVEGERLFLPEALVEQALRTAPGQVRLADSRGNLMELGGPGQYFSTGSDGQYILDDTAAVARPGTLADLVRLCRVADALPGISAVNLQLIPSEVQGHQAQLLAIAAVLSNSRKHHIAVPLSLELAKAWVEMVAIAEPDLRLQKAPILSGISVTMSPLVLDAENCCKLLFFADEGLPILMAPCPMAGASSPFTVAGTLVVAIAEALLQLALVQTYRPGSPVVLAGAPSIMDMATGTVSYAAPEFSLQCSGQSQITQHLGLPSYVPLAHPDSAFLDEQCAAEKAFSLLNVLASGAHLFGGAGSLGKTEIVSCEQLVIDNELFLWAERYVRGIEISEETLAEEVIAQVGPGGTFLEARHTLHFLRSSERFRPRISNRKLFEAGASTMLHNAHGEVERILKEAAPVLAEDTMADLERYAREKGQALDG
jgi:trimethylamine--corrinoid protein Co-methyltransferase